jgi:deoxyribose-phosphate aldolase
MQNVAGTIDHTLLRPDALRADIERLCEEALQHPFASVCVNGCWVELARDRLDESPVRVATVVGFPLGAMESDAKRYETEAAIDCGAQEIDMVLNVAWLKSGEDRLLLRELRDVVEAAQDRPVKVIIETCLLTDDEKRRVCPLIKESGAKFVKTSTGFSRGGAIEADVKLLRECVGPDFGVKASGGIRDLATARTMLAAGATRLGTSSGVAILAELAREGGDPGDGDVVGGDGDCS